RGRRRGAERLRGGSGRAGPRWLAERRADRLQGGVGDRVDGGFDLEQCLADGQPHRGPQERGLAGGEGRVVGQGADRVARAEGFDADGAVGLLLDADMVARDVAVLNDAARDTVPLGTATEFDRSGQVFKMLSFAFIADEKTKHGPGSFWCPPRPG